MSQQGGSKQRKLYSCYLEERKLFNQPIKAGSTAKKKTKNPQRDFSGVGDKEKANLRKR